MTDAADFDEAVSILKDLYRRSLSGDPEVPEINSIIGARDEVTERYQALFSRDNLPLLTEQDVRGFLQFKNNRHWTSLQRMGPAICKDMDRLREALRVLLDEDRPISDRFNELVPGDAPVYVPSLNKAILTPILLVSHPGQYGVWNQVSEDSMRALGLWPEFERGMPFGDRYERINALLQRVARAVAVDLWTLDALLWRKQQTD